MPVARSHWALSAVLPQSMLNRLVAEAVEAGVTIPAFSASVPLPLFGSIDVSVALRLDQVEFRLAAADGGRVRAVVRATGQLSATGGGVLPLPSAARVRGELLVTPQVTVGDDGSVSAYFDMAGAELVSLAFEAFEGLDVVPEALDQMSSMLMAAVAGPMWSGLREGVGPIGLASPKDLEIDVRQLGVASGPAVVRVADGRLEVALPAEPSLAGAAAMPIARDGSVGFGVASGVLRRYVAMNAGEWAFDVDLATTDDGLRGSVRGTRLARSSALPDLRTELHWLVEWRLRNGRAELVFRDAWVRLPVPGFTAVSRLATRMALRTAEHFGLRPTVSFPVTIELPLQLIGDRPLWLTITAIDMDDDGFNIVVEPSLVSGAVAE